MRSGSSNNPHSSLIPHRSSIILGVDPGLQRTGWGVISVSGNQLSFVAAGIIATKPDAPSTTRLKTLHDGLQEVILAHRPAAAAMEETFVNKNSASSLKLGQARGALLLTLALHDLAVAEYAANLVKKSVVGTGHAEKEQIAAMVRVLLPGCRNLEAGADAMDALAVAITHAHHAKQL